MAMPGHLTEGKYDSEGKDGLERKTDPGVGRRERERSLDGSLASSHAGGDALRRRRLQREMSRGPGTVWNSRFADKPRREVRRIIKEPWHYPMAAQNLAAIAIQRVARGYISRSGREAHVRARERARIEKAAALEEDEESKERRRQAPKALMEKFLKYTASEMRLAETPHPDSPERQAYEDWRLSRVQAWWRMLLVKNEYERNRHSMYHIASMQIQYLWRAHLRHRFMAVSGPQPRINAALSVQRAWRRWTNMRIFKYYRDLIRFRNTGDPRVMLRSINPREASLIDTASKIRVRFRLGGSTFPPTIYYKMFTNAPLCDVNSFAPKDYTREKGMEAAQRHNHAEGAPLDGHGPDDDRILQAAAEAGTGAVIRVGSSVFAARLPTGEARHMTGRDAATGGDTARRRKGRGALASLEVTRTRGGAGGRLGSGSVVLGGGMDSTYGPGAGGAAGTHGWYRRIENNGWRPVSLKSLEDADKDPVAAATARLAQEFHYSKLKRQEDVKTKRKRRKQRWLRRMYAEGLAKERGTAKVKKGGDVADVVDFDNDDWEKDAAALLEWSSALDFDSYVDDWAAVGTSAGPGVTEATMLDEESAADDDDDDYGTTW